MVRKIKTSTKRIFWAGKTCLKLPDFPVRVFDAISKVTQCDLRVSFLHFIFSLFFSSHSLFFPSYLSFFLSFFSMSSFKDVFTFFQERGRRRGRLISTIDPSTQLFVYLSMYLSIYLFISNAISLSIYL